MMKLGALLGVIFLFAGCGKAALHNNEKVRGIWVLESCSNNFEPNVTLSDCEKKTFYQFSDYYVFHSHSFVKDGNCETIKSKNNLYRVEDNQVYIDDNQVLFISVEGDQLITRTTTERGIDPVICTYRKVK